MTLVKWSPTGNLLRWRESLLDDFFSNDRFYTPSRENWYPVVDVHEDDDAYHFQMELPGLTKEDVKISFKDDVLTISGEKKAEQKEEKKNQMVIRQGCGKPFHLPVVWLYLSHPFPRFPYQW